ncbi:MAG TPA: MFS transporter [Clostridia bacterium]|nr:MFS transporter [Clostridia bacterium]
MSTQAAIPNKKQVFSSKPDLILTITLNVLMLFYAVSLTMLGPLMPGIIEQYRLELSQAGLISTFQSVGGVIFTILGGVLADHVRKSRLIGITFFAYSASLLAIALAPAYIAVLALFFVLGASTRMLDVLLNSYISDINPQRRGFHITMLGISFSIGGLLGPMFSTVLRNLGMRWHNTFLILGITCILITVMYAFILKSTKRDEKANKAAETANYLQLLLSPRLLVLCMIMFIFSAYQSGMSIWMPMYMESFLLAKPFLSSLAVSLFYIGTILGRSLFSIMFSEQQAKNIILIGSLSGAVVLMTGIMAGNPVLMAITSGVSGILTCAVLPLTITFACNYYPENSGAASSIILLNSVLSWMVFPWLIGFIADNASFQWGMLVMGLALIATFLLALTLPSGKGNGCH